MVARRAALADVRPRRARRSRARRLRRRRAALRPADQAGLPERARAGCRRSTAPTSPGSPPGWTSRRTSAATCGPTRCATCVGSGADTRLVVDFVLHLDDGATGPGSALGGGRRGRATGWWSSAPRRGDSFGGIEFDPGTAAALLLVADETAVPAVCSILERPARGRARRRVPRGAGVRRRARPSTRPPGWRWCGCRATAPRSGSGCTRRCWPTWARRPGARGRGARRGRPGPVGDPDVLLLGRGRRAPRTVRPRRRRDLRLDRGGVRRGHRPAPAPGPELGMDRRQVAFMGYWRRGVAMRS